MQTTSNNKSQRSTALQCNPDSRRSPTSLLSASQLLVSCFIALYPIVPVTLLERHRKCWTKWKAKLHQQPRQQKSYYRSNSTNGSKPELVHGVGACRCTAATTAIEGVVSPCLASMMLPNNIAHCCCYYIIENRFTASHPSTNAILRCKRTQIYLTNG